jgi:hypothetical protein
VRQDYLRASRSRLREFAVHSNDRIALRDLVEDQQGGTCRAWQSPVRGRARAGRVAGVAPEVRVNSTRQPASTRANPSAAARWLFPAPGGPNRIGLAPCSSQLSPAASAISCALLIIIGTASKSKLSRVLPTGSRASARWRSMRRRPHSATSCSAKAARKRAAGQPSLSAWSARPAHRRRMAGSRSSARISSTRAPKAMLRNHPMLLIVNQEIAIIQMILNSSGS